MPTYDLKTIKSAFKRPKKLRITATALAGARSIGFTMGGIVDTIQSIKRSDFVKLMTTHRDHRVWQDVYNTEFNSYVIYVKFQIAEDGHFVISFKEK